MERKEIELSKLKQEENARSIYRNEELQDLMASMGSDGLLQPIGVLDIGKGEYEILFGNRRFMAAKKLGWHSIPCTIMDLKADEDKESINLIENIKRSDITSHDEGRVYSLLMKKGLSTAEICARLNLKVERVRACLDVYQSVPKELKGRIVSTISSAAKHKGKITAGTASSLMSISREGGLSDTQTKFLFEKSTEMGLTTPQSKQLGKIMSTGVEPKEALRKIEQLEVITLSFAVTRKTREAVQKKYGKSFYKVVMAILRKYPELGIENKLEAHKLVTKSPKTAVIKKTLPKDIEYKKNGKEVIIRRGVR